MGLSVQVGVLADVLENDPDCADTFRERFASANRILANENLPLHEEPESLPQLRNRCDIDGYPYSFLHYLRRAYAQRKAKSDWVAQPLPPDKKPTQDAVLQSEYRRQQSHLLTHSDSEGFYLPIDFTPVLFDRSEGLPGEMIGSSYRLLDELILVAPAIGILINGRELPDSQADEINRVFETQQGLYIEKMVWLSLFEAARLSIEHRTAIYFG